MNVFATDATLRIILKAQNDAKRVIDEAGGGLAGLGGIAKAAGATAAIALAAAGIASVAMAKDFQFSTETIVTGAGEDQAALEGVRQGLLQMAGEVGKTPQELAKGLYDIESAGFHGANGLNILRVASKAATVTNTESKIVADALTSALNAYHLPASEAAHVTDMMIETVRRGKVEMSDLATNIGKVIPVGSQANVSFKELGAAIAVMTNHGSNAAIATTSLRYLMSSLLNATGPARKAMEDFGLTNLQVADTMREKGLNGALTLITDAIKTKFPEGSSQYINALAKMVGGTRGLNAALNLTGTNAAEFKNMIDDVGHASDGAGKLEEGWKEHSKDLNVVQARLMASVQSLGIIIGTIFLPVLADLGNALIPLVGGSANFIIHLENLGGKMQWSGNMAQNLFHNLVLLGVPLETAARLADTLGPSLDTLGQILDEISRGFKNGANASTVLVGVLTDLGVPLGVIRAILGVFNGLWQTFSDYINIAKDAARQFVDELMKNSPELRDAFNQILPVLAVVGAILGALIGGVFAAFIRVLRFLLPDAIHAAVLVILILADIIRIVGAIVGGVIRVIADLLRGDGSQAWRDFLDIFVQVGTALTNLVQHVFDLIGTIIHAALNLVLNLVVGFVGGVIGAFKNMAQSLVGGSVVPDMVNRIVSWFVNLPGRIMGAIGGLVGSVVGTFYNMAVGAVNQVASMAGGVWNAMGNVVQAVLNAAGQVYNAGIQVGQNIVNGILNALGSLASRVGSAVSGAISSATSGIGGQLHALGVPGFALGGFVPGPTGAPGLAMVHGGELILNPEQQNYLMAGLAGRGGGGSESQTIVVQLVLDGKQLADVVLRRAGNRIRLQGGGLGSGA